jgi:hypothetical protein
MAGLEQLRNLSDAVLELQIKQTEQLLEALLARASKAAKVG